MDFLIHAANVLYLLSYSMRDILWLRVLTVAAACFMMPYFYFQPDPLYPPILWNLLFVALNVFWIARLLLERRPVNLTDDEHRLCQIAFHTLTPREMKKILALSSWEDAIPGECFVSSGAPLERLILIYSGKADVELDGQKVGELNAGQFIGELGYFTDEVAAANVVATEATRYVAWPKDRLKNYLEKNSDLRAAFQIILGSVLAKRLKDSWIQAIV
jgi:hypothetical protein